MRSALPGVRRVVVKIGSSLLTNHGAGLDRPALEGWVAQLATLRSAGRDVLLVSSGAVACGMQRLAVKKRPRALHELQALAALGQMGLIEAYETAFARHGRHAAQVLLTHDDLADRKRYLNARSALRALLSLGVVPIINENDTVATEEISVGDNDTLAAQLAILVGARRLVILTDTEGVYRFDPRSAASPELVRQLGEGDPLPELGQANRGRGGMITKIAAARLAGAAGIETVITSAHHQGPIGAILRGEEVGTKWTPRTLNSTGS